MLNVTNHKGNTKHNHNEILPYTNQDGNYLQKYIYIQKITSFGKEIGERETLCLPLMRMSNGAASYGGSLKN